MKPVAAVALFVALSLACSLPVCAEFVCGVSDTTATRETLAPHTGNTKALIILVRFYNDNTNHGSSCYADFWPYTLGDTLPSWARDSTLIHATTDTANFVEGSLSHYWHMMSQGQYCFYGDVYPEVYIPQHPSTYYDTLGCGYLNKEILTDIDDEWDFSPYDNNPADGVVDAIQICYRWSSDGILGMGGIGGLAQPADWGEAITTNDSVWSDALGGSVAVEITIDSGTTQWTPNHLGALQTMCHEWGHCLLGGDHTTAHGGRWVLLDMCGAGIAMCAYERLLLDWVDPIEVNSTTFADTLHDALTTGQVVKVVLGTADTSGYYLVANRQPISFYDRPHPDYGSCDIRTPGSGLLITEVFWKQFVDGSSRWSIDIECADGIFGSFQEPNAMAGADALDECDGPSEPDCCAKGAATNTFYETNNNTFAPYTNPNTYVQMYSWDPEWWWIPYKMHTGFGLCNMRESAADSTVMIGDFVFGMPEDEITVLTTWSGRVILETDLTISDQLTIAPGTTVWIADNKDRLHQGLDTTRTEIIVGDGGTLEAVGDTASADSIWIVPDAKGSESWKPGDWYGVVLNSGGEATLECCDLGYGVKGLTVGSAAAVYIQDSNIHDNSDFGLYVTHPDADAVRVRASVIEGDSIGIVTEASCLDLGDMSDRHPWNAGWNTISGDDSCMSNRSGTTVLAVGNYWGSGDSSTVASKISADVDYGPWLPVPPESISTTASYAQAVDDSGDATELIRGLCPEGDATARKFRVACVVKDLAGNPVVGLDSAFMYLTVAGDTLTPTDTPCPNTKPLTNGNTTYRFWCVPNDTIFACESTDASGEGMVIEEQVSGWARLFLTLHVGPLTATDTETMWINSFDFVPLPPNGLVNFSDIAAFTAAKGTWNEGNGDQTWYCDFVLPSSPPDTCIVDTEKKIPSYGITLGDIAAFTCHINDTKSCGSE